MKKSLTLLVLLITCFTAAKAQIPNGDFETWTTNGGYSTPDGWWNFNPLTASNSVYTCEKGTTGAPHGNAFLMLTTKLAGSSVVPGLAQTGVYDPATKQPVSGYAYTGRPANLTGKFQYMMAGPDTGRIIGFLTKWNAATSNTDVIAEFKYDFWGMAMSWTSFSVPLTYLSSATPDSAIVALVSSNKNATAGTYLYVDSINFSGSAASVPGINYSKYSMKLSPNPAKDHLSVDFGITVTDDIELSVSDIYGNTVAETTWSAGKSVYSMNLNAIAAGIYFVRVKAGDDIQAKRLVIQ